MLFTDIDAAGKPRSGILRKNLAMFGSYSGCLALSDAKYCLSAIGINYAPLNIVCKMIYSYIGYSSLNNYSFSCKQFFCYFCYNLI